MGNSEICRGRLRIGVVCALSGEKIERSVLDLTLCIANFPKVEKFALEPGNRVRRHILFEEVRAAKGTVAVDAAGFLECVKELRWFGPGDCDFPRNAALLDWLIQRVRETTSARFPHHHRYLVFLHSLPPLPQELAPSELNASHIMYAIGRRIAQEADFIAVCRDRRLDFLKNRAGATFPEGSWEV